MFRRSISILMPELYDWILQDKIIDENRSSQPGDKVNNIKQHNKNPVKIVEEVTANPAIHMVLSTMAASTTFIWPSAAEENSATIITRKVTPTLTTRETNPGVKKTISPTIGTISTITNPSMEEEVSKNKFTRTPITVNPCMLNVIKALTMKNNTKIHLSVTLEVKFTISNVTKITFPLKILKALK